MILRMSAYLSFSCEAAWRKPEGHVKYIYSFDTFSFLSNFGNPQNFKLIFQTKMKRMDIQMLHIQNINNAKTTKENYANLFKSYIIEMYSVFKYT